jgi:hypothetical protein
MEVLRGLSEQLVALCEGNPQPSSATLAEAAESAVQALIASAKRAKEQQRQSRPRYLLSTFEVPREAFQNRAGQPDRRFLDHLLAGRCSEPVQRSSRCTTTLVASGPSCMRQRRPHQELPQSTELWDCTCTEGGHQGG